MGENERHSRGRYPWGRFQGRGGKGVLNFRVTAQTGAVVAIKEVFPDDELMLITRNGVVIRQRVEGIRAEIRAIHDEMLAAL